MNTPALTAKKPLRRLLALGLAGIGFILAATGMGCVNTRLPSKTSQVLSKGGVGAGTGATGASGPSQIDQFVIGNVLVAPAPTGSAANTAPGVLIYLDPSHGTAAGGATSPPIISQHCATGTTATNSKPCLCNYSWSETNASSGNNLSFTRTFQTPVTNVQQQLIGCLAPNKWTTEIADGTTVKMTVIPAPGNADASLFAVNTWKYVKATTVSAGSFQDAQGHAFENIVHYSCYEQFKIGTSITSKMGTKTNPTTGETTNYPIANQFCVQKPGSQPSANCPTLLSNTTNSAQAYYYNFFTRVSTVGAVNQWNDRYTCPSIKEPIYGSGTVGSQGQLYPMDSNFALGVNASPTFNVGVNGFVELSDGGGDPIAANATLCDGSATGTNNAATDGFVQACLGFAAKPAADGTCPYVRDASGGVRFTYRLRRFVALYPPLFGIDGAAPTLPQRHDTVYVLDRPVSPPVGADPLKPFSMRGPKPCPFALFDAQGVLNYQDTAYPNQKLPIYGATNNSNWNGTNVDGIQFPNFDGPTSCSAPMPLVLSNLLNPDQTTIAIGTINAKNPVMTSVYVRPIHAWAPHYEEDTAFQACAPQASPQREAPLHFSKDLTTGNVSWCSEVYPSQNDHVGALDRLADVTQPSSPTNPYIGHVRPFTSHVVKNSLSADCKASLPSSIPAGALYPAASSITTKACVGAANGSPTGLARHPSDLVMDTRNNYDASGKPPCAGSTLVPPACTNALISPTTYLCADQTCDRTAIVTGGLGWTQFPLLASAPQVEQAIASDTTYGCVITYDAGGAKAGKATPSAGCCGANVTMNTGLLAPTTTGSQAAYLNRNAHLEPDVPCLIPKY